MCLAIPGQIVDLEPAGDLATVVVSGVRRRISVGLLDGGVAPGDWVLIHVGFAIARVDEEEAAATLRLLAEAGEAYEQELAELRASAIE
jgi:hydrogenase expression/formation protein HypC